MSNKQKIGELLLELNIINQKDLNSALEEQKITGDRLGTVLLKMDILSEESTSTTTRVPTFRVIMILSIGSKNRTRSHG